MGSDLQGRVWRESDLDTLPDEPWKYEIVSGNLLREPLPMPRHARIAARIAALLDVWARRERTGVVCAGDPGFVLARGDILTGGESLPGLRIPIDDVFDPY